MTPLLFLYSNDSPAPPAAQGSDFDAQPFDAAQLVQRLESGAPSQAVVAMPAAQLIAALAAWPDGTPCAVSLISAAPQPALLQRLQAQGLAGWWPQTCTAQDLAAGLALDRWRWEERKTLRSALAGAQGQLADRKWLERA
ncbi:MAG: hypothetical protein RR852_08860, partial [Comamonas sp.]